jgi:hypothetical protein
VAIRFLEHCDPVAGASPSRSEGCRFSWYAIAASVPARAKAIESYGCVEGLVDVADGV